MHAHLPDGVHGPLCHDQGSGRKRFAHFGLRQYGAIQCSLCVDQADFEGASGICLMQDSIHNMFECCFWLLRF